MSAERFAAVIVEVADTLVADFDLIDFLHTVTRRAAELVDAAAVGIMLADAEGQLHFVAASDEAAQMLELFQLQNREGPCLEAFSSGRVVRIPNLAAENDRWPRFAPQAVAAGFNSVEALPMRLRDSVIGALNIFTVRQQSLNASELSVLRALTDVATISLLQERAIQRSALLAEQLQKALTSRVIIEQAKGALAQVHGISTDRAFEVLRSYARRHHHHITDLARTCLDEPALVTELMRPQS